VSSESCHPHFCVDGSYHVRLRSDEVVVTYSMCMCAKARLKRSFEIRIGSDPMIDSFFRARRKRAKSMRDIVTESFSPSTVRTRSPPAYGYKLTEGRRRRQTIHTEESNINKCVTEMHTVPSSTLSSHSIRSASPKHPTCLHTHPYRRVKYQ
jgi:hypothetical protein